MSELTPTNDKPGIPIEVKREANKDLTDLCYHLLYNELLTTPQAEKRLKEEHRELLILVGITPEKLNGSSVTRRAKKVYNQVLQKSRSDLSDILFMPQLNMRLAVQKKLYDEVIAGKVIRADQFARVSETIDKILPNMQAPQRHMVSPGTDGVTVTEVERKEAQIAMEEAKDYERKLLEGEIVEEETK